jgi:phospholipid/cholesterol/gamma-HCH transport system substrate-binding protein
MNRNSLEALVGCSVLCITIFFALFVYKSTEGVRSHQNTYSLNAKFQNVEGIASGSDVMIAGVKVGRVDSVSLDKKNFMAVAVLNIDSDIPLATDSQASVLTGGLLGSKYLSIIPGSDESLLKDGDQIKYTQSAINIESLIGRIVYSIGSK